LNRIELRSREAIYKKKDNLGNKFFF
jgi:hypothetical protein